MTRDALAPCQASILWLLTIATGIKARILLSFRFSQKAGLNCGTHERGDKKGHPYSIGQGPSKKGLLKYLVSYS